MAALNIKEASDIHAEAFLSGELKHGVLALVEEGTLVIVFQSDRTRAHNAAAEVRARGGIILAINSSANDVYDDHILMPMCADEHLEMVAGIIPGQLLAYELAVLRGVNPDEPRNLAKSVTVL